VLFIIYNKVVSTEWMLRNAIRVRFEEGVELLFGLEKVRKKEN